MVLILGRFTPERKAIFDTLQEELRRRNYLPMTFDFDRPSNRDLAETLSTLAHMSRFVIADLTDAKAAPQKLLSFVPQLPSVLVQPILLTPQREYGMFEDVLHRYPWVLKPFFYEDQKHLSSGPAQLRLGLIRLDLAPTLLDARLRTLRPEGFASLRGTVFSAG